VIPGKQYSPEELVALAWARKWLIVTCTFVGMFAAFGASLWMKNQYQSETLIMVVPNRVPDDYVRSTITARIEDRLNSITQQIQSRSSLERFITQFDLYPSLRDKESIDSLVLHMRDDIKVEVVKGDSFRVRYTSESPRTAQLVAASLAKAYIDENLSDRDVAAKNTTAFLRRELDGARIRLQEQEKRLEEYKHTYAGELPSQLTANQDALGHARMVVRVTNEEIVRQRERRDLLESEVADLVADRTPPPAVSGPITDTAPNSGATLEQQLAAARTRFAEVAAKFTADHPDYRAAARKVKDLENDLARAGGAAAQPPGSAPSTVRADAVGGVRQNKLRQLKLDIASLDRQIAAKQAEVERLNGEIGMLQRRIDSTPTRETELVQLTRDYETIQEIYKSLLSRSENSMLAEKLEEQKIGEQFKILDEAKIPERPVSPNRPRLALAGAFCGLFLAVAVVGLREYTNASLRTEEDVVACIGLPVIAVIPVLTDRAALSGGRVKRVLGALTGSTTAVVAVLSTFLR
jgi:polysaccharide chain length determinant protein (PEP-CTERM system associated)